MTLDPHIVVPLSRFAATAARLHRLLGRLRGDCDGDVARIDALAAFGVRVASAGLLYLSQVVLARWMGGADYGIYVLAWSWVLVLGGLASLGFATSVLRIVPEYRERGDMARLRGVLTGSRTIAFVSGTVVAALGIIGLWLAKDRIDPHYLVPASLALVCVPVYALTDVQDGIGRARSWMMVALLPPYLLRPLLVLLGVTTAHLLGLPTDATTAAGAAIAATWASGFAQLIFLDRRLSAEVAPGKAVYATRDWLGISLPMMLITAAELVQQNADIIILSRHLAAADIGIYFAAVKTMSLIAFVHYAVGSVAANRFAALGARGDHRALEAFVFQAARWVFWPSLLAGAAILALGWPLLRLFGPQFTSGYPVMFVLAAGFMIRAAVGSAEFMLPMLGQQTAAATVNVVTAVLNIVLLLMLVPAHGPLGAAAASAIALIVAAGMNYTIARRQLGIDVAIWVKAKT